MAYEAESILPYNSPDRKSLQVARMFDAIAGTYDRLNHTLSLGLDKGWRKKGIASLRPYSPANILDLATGTGDLALLMCGMLRPQSIIAADISEKMMERGREKVAEAGCQGIISFEYQDCLSLTYGNQTFDAVTSAFGIRNFEDMERGIAEMYRVLRPGGRVMILELSSPTAFPMKQLYSIYSGTAIPAAGRLLSKEKQAYRYLPASVKAVPQGEEMKNLLSRQGFVEAEARTFTCGICSLYTGAKN
ncbi:demethylmenaquinone methyltransferase [Bacteroidia bacterium]|nr:demethylmenaquinone methyltransferase [Bacteroidia bacterium]